MILNEDYQLYNGVKIPKLGFGTWKISNDDATAAVKSALKLGYRHIDTAAAYENECGVGLGISQSGINRNELFITTKIPAEVKTYAGAKTVIENSLKNLNSDYIDLMLIHAPKPWQEMSSRDGSRYFKENLEVWAALQEAYKSGKIRAIGVSNFEICDLENITAHSEVKPMVNQIQAHVGYTPVETIEYCKKHGIVVTAYSPNANGRLLNNATVAKLAAKYKVTVAQLCIRYCLQLGLQPIPKTTHEEFMKQNTELDFVISDSDMQILLQL